MKKVIFILISVFVLLMPTITAINFQKTNSNEYTLETSDDTPAWADGSFSGKWGIREYSILFQRLINIELGNVSGYYSNGFLNRIDGKFIPRWNESLETRIVGRYIGPFIFGSLGNLEMEDPDYSDDVNQTFYVGLGTNNETVFDFRLMGQEGPTFYMKGTFSKFN
jgi:hypothetical protein